MDDLEFDAENGAVALSRQFVIIHVAAAVNGTQEIFAPRFDPLDGLVDLNGHVAHQRFFSVDVQLAAESTADLRRYHAHAVLFEPQHLRHQRTHQVWNLRRCIEIELAVGSAPLRHHAPRLHGHGDQSLAGYALLDHDIGFRERFIHLATFLVIGKRDVVRPLGVHCWSALGLRFLRIGYRWEHLVVHFNEVGRIARQVAVRRHHHGHGMSDEVNPVGRQNMVMGHA